MKTIKYRLAINILLTLTSLISPLALSSPATEAFNAKNYQEAKALFNQSSSTAESQYYLGRIALIEKNLDQAEQHLEKAVSANPENSDYHYWFAIMSSRQASSASFLFAPGYASDALEHFKKAVSISPDSISAMKGLINFYINAPSIAGGSHEKAHAVIDKLYAADKKQGLISRLKAYRSEENTSKEKQIAERLASEFLQSAEAQFQSAMSFQTTKQYEKAVATFTRASKILPQKPTESEWAFINGSLYQIGRTAVFSGQYTQQGIEALVSYLNKETGSNMPSKNWAKYRLAMLYVNNSDKSAAINMLTSVVSDESDKDLYKRTKKLLKKLKAK